MIKKSIVWILAKFGYQLKKMDLPSKSDIAVFKRRNIDLMNKISPGLKVLDGPFKGLLYPTPNISEAAFLPKLVGAYESQLHSLIQRIINTGYSDVIDVGCAEGYYAVGLARRMPNTIIHAFDINKEDISFCKKMAVLNNVHNIRFGGYFSPDDLRDFPHSGRLLVFCDAEGFELDLFTPDVINSMVNTDFLIEMHDVINPVISVELTSRFRAGYNIEIVNNRQVDAGYFLSRLHQLNESDREFAILEHRGGLNRNCFMEWGFFTSK